MILRAFTLCLLLLLTACNPSVKPDWYVSQGFTRSECGPAVAAMAERMVRGNSVTRFQTRQFSPYGMNSFGWWNLSLIHSYLDSVGVSNSYRAVEYPLRRGVYHVDGNHFVIVMPKGGGIVQVANPFGNVGVTSQSSQQFKERITQSYYVGF